MLILYMTYIFSLNCIPARWRVLTPLVTYLFIKVVTHTVGNCAAILVDSLFIYTNPICMS